MTPSPLESDLFAALNTIAVLPRRLVLCTPGVEPHVPLLRGVWGNALHAVAPRSYREVFFPEDDSLSPCYVLRGAEPDPHGFPRVDQILIGKGVDHDHGALAAWLRACEWGLGPDRVPFFLRGHCLGPDGQRADASAPWKLGQAQWPLPGSPATTPCRIQFHEPLRLLRQGKLITHPTLVDLVVAMGRRVSAYLPAELLPSWEITSTQAREAARSVPSLPWTGHGHDLVRWSGRQQTEVQMRGVSGFLDLPFGPGPVWPLLAAGLWLHLGKGTVMGLGRPSLRPIQPLTPPTL